jgi:hypothetical protein
MLRVFIYLLVEVEDADRVGAAVTGNGGTSFS